MNPVRVLIVEDSPTVRLLLEEIILADARLQLLGSCASGEEALRFVERQRPDVISMDILLPGIDGHETIRRLLSSHPIPVVVISSTTSSAESRHAMEALHAGALTVLPKPEGPEAPNFDRQQKKITDTLYSMSQVRVIRRSGLRASKSPPAPVTAPPPPRSAPPPPVSRLPAGQSTRIVGIAASTGGPPALVDLLAPLPKDFPLPILLVQHIAPGFGESFAEWLDSVISLPVWIPRVGESLNSPGVRVAPDGLHLGVSRGTVALLDTPPVGVHKPSADVLFQSLAHEFRRSAAGFILTGMGRDGARGLLELRRAGGLAIGQEESSCAVFGMSQAAWEIGACSSLQTLPAMTQLLRQLAEHSTVSSKPL